MDNSNAVCTLAGWFRIRGRRWVSVDSLKRPSCATGAVEVTRDSGVLVRRHDTLSFFGNSTKRDDLRQRGVLRRDTLTAGGWYFDGPPLVYVHVY